MPCSDPGNTDHGSGFRMRRNYGREELFNDPETNFTEQQLEAMLDEEMEKPVEEIDMKLVDDLLACLDPREVTEEEINRGLAKLQEAFRRLENNE